MNEKVQNLANTLIPDEYKKNKYFSLMLFEEYENEWVHLGTRRFENGMDALNAYANIPCPASQLIEAMTIEELETKESEMIENFKNPEWLEEFSKYL